MHINNFLQPQASMLYGVLIEATVNGEHMLHKPMHIHSWGQLMEVSEEIPEMFTYKNYKKHTIYYSMQKCNTIHLVIKN